MYCTILIIKYDVCKVCKLCTLIVLNPSASPSASTGTNVIQPYMFPFGYKYLYFDDLDQINEINLKVLVQLGVHKTVYFDQLLCNVGPSKLFYFSCNLPCNTFNVHSNVKISNIYVKWYDVMPVINTSIEHYVH